MIYFLHVMKLKPLSVCYLRRPKHYFKVKVLSDHFPYPAVTICHFSNEWIVKREELITEEEFNKDVLTKLQAEAREELKDFLEAWNRIPEQPKRFHLVGIQCNVPACAAASMARRCKRLGLIQ